MGHSLVYVRLHSLVLELRPSSEQSKGMCSKYDPTYDIKSTSRVPGKVGIVGELTSLSFFQGRQIEILSDSNQTQYV